MKKHLRLKSALFFGAIVSLALYFQNCADGSTGAWNTAAAPQTNAQGSSTPLSCTLDGVTMSGSASGTTSNFITAYPSRTSPAGVPCIVTGQTRYCTNGVLSGSFPYSTCSDTGALSCSFNGASISSNTSVDAFNTNSVPYGTSCGGGGVPSSYYLKRTCSNGILSGDSSFSFASCTTSAPGNCVFNGQTVLNGASVDTWSTSTVPYGVNCGNAGTAAPYYMSRTCSNTLMSGNPSFSFASCTPGAALSCTIAGQAIASGTNVQALRPPVAATLYDGTCGSPQTRQCINGAWTGDANYSLLSCPTPQGCSISLTTPTGIQVVGGNYNSATGKCVFPVCNGANSSDCDTKTDAGREIDARLPQMTANVKNLCKKYNADYDFYYVQRTSVIPNCGYYYGLAYATNTTGGFSWNQQPLCYVRDTGFPVPTAVWCSQTTPAGRFLPEPGSLPTLTKGTYNSVPFDSDPHDNSSPRYCAGVFSTVDNACCSLGLDANGSCLPFSGGGN